MATEYRDQIAARLNLKPISESQLRDRSKKICTQLRKPAVFIFQLLAELEQWSGDQCR